MGCIECTTAIVRPSVILSPEIQKVTQMAGEKSPESPEHHLMLSEKDTKTQSLPQLQLQLNNEVQMLNEINLARSNPKAFAIKISKVLNKIQCVEDKQMLIYDDELQIEVAKGGEAFESCIYYLNNKYKETPPLILINELKIPFPKDKNQMLNRDYLGSQLEKKIKEVEGKYTIIDFQYDITPNPSISILIQVVDDSESLLQRRKNILNKNAKYVGITCECLKKDIMCFYLVFAH